MTKRTLQGPTTRKGFPILHGRCHSLVCGLILLLGAETAVAQIRTVLVSPVPGDPVASGTTLRNALSGISAPSATNRWLLKIEPGIYDIGATSLTMRPWVDIEGSGIGTTTIRGSVNGSGLNAGTVNGADNSELRFLTVEAIGTPTVVTLIAMYNDNASPRLYRVKFFAQASGSVRGILNSFSAPLIEECEISASATTTLGSSQAYGVVFAGYLSGRRSSILRSRITATQAADNFGIYLQNAQTVTEIRDTVVNVVGGVTTWGIYATTSVGGSWIGQENLALRNTELSSAGGASGSYGIAFQPSSWIGMDIFASRIYGHVAPTTYGIMQQGPAGIGIQGSTVVGFTKTVYTASSVSIASTYLNGGPVTALGWLGCMGVWDESGVFFANSCPP